MDIGIEENVSIFIYVHDPLFRVPGDLMTLPANLLTILIRGFVPLNIRFLNWEGAAEFKHSPYDVFIIVPGDFKAGKMEW